MNRKLRVGIDNLTQDLKDLTLPATRHTLIGIIALSVCIFINAWAIALPFGLCLVMNTTGPLLLLFVTPFICVGTVLLLTVILSKIMPRQGEDTKYSLECYKLLKEIKENGVTYHETRPESTNFRGQRYTGPEDADAARRAEYYSSKSQAFGEANAAHGRVPSGTCFRETSPQSNFPPEARGEGSRERHPYEYREDDCPSTEEVRSFYRRDGRERPLTEDDQRRSEGVEHTLTGERGSTDTQ
jgi:hypothetical protein